MFIPKADATKGGFVKRAIGFKESLAKKLQNLTATKFHLALDAWTSSNCFTFLAITCYYINDDWVLCEELLSFDDTVDDTGDGMAKIVMEVLKNVFSHPY